MTEGETSPPPPSAAPSEETPATAPHIPPPIPITIFISGSSGSKVVSQKYQMQLGNKSNIFRSPTIKTKSR